MASREQDTDTHALRLFRPQPRTLGRIILAIYEDSLWQAGSQSAQSTTVSGIGDAAFKGWPTPGTLNVKVKGYMVTVGVTDFNKAVSLVDPESLQSRSSSYRGSTA